MAENLGDNLEALILVGSYSRGEGIDGLSDIEFWAVVKDLSQAKKPELDSNISLGFTTRKHLKKLKPYIYTVEVKKYGKVLYRDKDILNLIPDYSFEDIDPIDGFILLNNRLIEQLILFNKISDKKTVQYDFDKSYIQLVNSLLVLSKSYKSLYPEKLVEFHKIYKDKDAGFLNKTEEAFDSIKHLQEEIASGTACPRNDTYHSEARNDVDRKEALKKWLEIREYFRIVWLDEKKTIGNIKCWIQVLLSGRPMRYFVYQKAAKLYFSNEYQNKNKRDKVIENWEKFVK